jgi:glycine/sarcosine N-methyltransferase
VAERDPYSRVEYRRLIAWPERIRREWPLLEEVLGSGPSRRVLELGCGPGEHARALADAGYHVVAVDRSPDMLAQAAEQPLPANLRFVEGDIAQVDRLVEGSFGGALCLGNTLPHLTTDQELATFAASLARALEPGAPLLVQVLNYDRIHDQGLRALPVNVRPHEEGELVFLRLMTPLPDGRVRFFPSTLLLRPGVDPPLAIERSREVLLRGWRRGELEAALSAAGIAPERALGDFAGAPFDPGASQDLVLVARRSIP